MKHEVINVASTQSVLRMMFECKTFDEKNDEKEVRRFETVHSFSKDTLGPVVSISSDIKAIAI